MASPYFKSLLKFSVAVLQIIHITATDYCKIYTRLELVFLVDNSDPYPLEKIKDIVTIAENLKLKYGNARFGLSLYSDFECKAWNSDGFCESPVGNKQHNDPHACYNFKEGLTTEWGKIVKRAGENIEVKHSNITEAGINGLLMTAADNRMGWTRGKDHGGLVRLIIVVTDDGTHDGGPLHNTWNGKPRKPVRGDGTDQCETMKGATTTDANKVLGRDQISVYVLVRAKVQFMWNSWRDKLGSMGDVRHRMQSLDDTKQEILKNVGHYIDLLSGDVGKVDCNQCCTIT